MKFLRPLSRQIEDAGHRPAQWAVLLLMTLGLVSVLELAHLPAAAMLGALVAGVVLSSCGGQLSIPRKPFLFSQGLVGCLIAHSIDVDILSTMSRQWPMLLAFVVAVILFSTILGGLLAYCEILPGTTAIWGSSPGGASVMVLMSESFGADIRLVAFMQFTRIAFVAAVASAISRLWMPPESAIAAAVVWFPPLDSTALAQTLAIAVIGAWAGTVMRIPAGAMLVPMFAGIALSAGHVVALVLPPWLMVVCYAIIGWSIGLRFTREVVRHAARAFPGIAASTLMLVLVCGGLAYLLHVYGGVSPLTAYLATSPGGSDSIAIIAASSPVDLPFVMSMQTARFLIVMAVGPVLAKGVSNLVQRSKKK